MDVSSELADYAEKHTTLNTTPASDITVDAGLLAAFDYTPLDPQEYSSSLNPHLLQLTLNSTQALLSSLFSLPTASSSLGPVATLPPPITLLPREKPLPKPKPETKWERFAKAKGISHSKKEKDVWDDERQEWVPRWGRGGKNKEKEEQWIHEVKAGDNADLDPAVTARLARKNRTAKNLRQQARNISDAASKPSPLSTLDRKPRSTAEASQAEKKSSRDVRKAELERSMLISKSSTASLGKFDKKIEGEPKVRGMKRKFEANVPDSGYKGEKERSMGLLAGVGKGVKRKGGEGEEGGLNVRKAVRFQGREERRGGGAGGARGGRGGGRGGRGGKR